MENEERLLYRGNKDIDADTDDGAGRDLCGPGTQGPAEEEKSGIKQEITQENTIVQEISKENVIPPKITQEITKENEIGGKITKEITKENVWDISWEEIIENPLERKIVELLLRTPEITSKELGGILDIPMDAVNYRLRKLRNSGLIKHQGATKAGKWVITAKTHRDDS